MATEFVRITVTRNSDGVVTNGPIVMTLDRYNNQWWPSVEDTFPYNDPGHTVLLEDHTVEQQQEDLDNDQRNDRLNARLDRLDDLRGTQNFTPPQLAGVLNDLINEILVLRGRLDELDT